MKRTFGVIGCAAAVTLLLCSLLELRVVLACGVLCLSGAVAVFFLPLRQYRSTVAAVLLTATVAACLFVSKSVFALQPVLAHSGETATLIALVEDAKPSDDDGADRYTLRVTAGDLPVGTKLLYWQTDKLRDWQVGDGVTGEFALISVEQQTGDRLLAGSAQADGIYLYSWPAEFGSVSRSFEAGELSWFDRAVHAVRSYAKQMLAIVGGESYGISAGIALGDVDLVSEPVSVAFRRSGISHLLVVSGLHVSMVTLGLFYLLRKRLYARTAALITLPVLLVFMCLMGLTPSVIRAGVMMAIVLVSHLFRRQADSLNSMGLAFVVLALANPFCIYDIGLQLSFGATLGILRLYPPISTWLLGRLHLHPYKETVWWRKRLLIPLVQSAVVTLAATVVTLPLSAVYFGEISLVSPLTNLLTLFPAQAVLITSWAIILFGWFPFVGRLLAFLFGWATKLLCAYLIGVTELFGNWGGAVVSMRRPYLVCWLIGALLLLLLGYKLLKGRGLRIAALCSAVALVIGVTLNTALTYNTFTVTASHRMDGYAVLVQQNGSAGLIVNGNRQSWKTAEYLMDDAGVITLDFVYASEEWDADQYERFSARYPITTVTAATGGFPSLSDGGSLTFWEDCSLMTDSGFIRVNLRNTAVLICPPHGDAGILPEEWQTASAVIYNQQAPARAGELTALQAVWLCDNAGRADTTATLPWGLYPIAVPAEGSETVLLTRGNGDLSLN